MKILFLGLNYSPEEIGIAAYSTGMCEHLAEKGHEVRAVVGKPYYPDWKVPEAYRSGGAKQSRENDVELIRVPHYVPANPTGLRRVIHHVTFALSSMIPMLHTAREFRPDVVMTVAPSTIAAPVARIAARFAGAKSWLHIQDFEVGAAFATGLVSPSGFTAKIARAFEKWVVGGFDRVSSISHEMCQKIGELGVPNAKIVSFRNWAEIDSIEPLDRPSSYREKWDVTATHVALYSGNIANKQGINIVVDVARALSYRTDLEFVVCGNGPNREQLEKRAEGLGNIQFHDLQPKEALCELMNLATIHLLPQKADAADLVLPSKLTNMLASGRPVIATAVHGTGLAREIAGCGVTVPPEKPALLAQAIEELLDDPARHAALGAASREAALVNWSKREILGKFESKICDLTKVSGPQGTFLEREQA